MLYGTQFGTPLLPDACVKAQGSQQDVFPSTSRAKLLVIQGIVHLSLDFFFTDKFIESFYATLIRSGQRGRCHLVEGS